MTGAGHTHTGIGMSIGIFYASYVYGCDQNIFIALASAFICISGATAPDWLEIRKKGGGTVIKHRTITHWVLLWVGALYLGYYMLETQMFGNLYFEDKQIAVQAISNGLIAFTIGGLSHLLTDFPNKMGIPIFLPNQRFCLGWWKSGNSEPFLISLSYIASFIFISVDTGFVVFDFSKITIT